MGVLKQFWSKYGINPLDQLLKRARRDGKRKVLVCWNRGLGDIPLGLYALTLRIREFLPEAEITYLTRSDLQSGFELLGGVSVLVDPEWKRGVPFDVAASLKRCGRNPEEFDFILERPDPTRWLVWQLGTLTPQLHWNAEWDGLSERFGLDKNRKYMGVHVQTETQYQYEKNWPVEYWERCFTQCVQEHDVYPILFGFAKTPLFPQKGVVDLRGETSLFDMLSIIKNYCSYLLVPDSGVLSILYYLNTAFPIDVVSLWADPRQGVLRQNVASPNPLLRHRPLVAQDKDLKTVSVDTALHALFSLRGVS